MSRRGDDLHRDQTLRPSRREDAEITLAFDDNRHASLVFGQFDQNLASRAAAGVALRRQWQSRHAERQCRACEHARRALETLYERVNWARTSASATSTAPSRKARGKGNLFRRRNRRAAASSRSARASAARCAPATLRRISICAR